MSDLPAYRDSRGNGVPDYEAIVDAIKTTIKPATWRDVGDEGGEGTIAAFDQAGLQAIVISQPWKIHREIGRLLVGLRERRGPLPTREQIAKLPPLPPAGIHDLPGAAGPSPRRGQEEPASPAPPADSRREAIVAANNQFALDLYRQLGRSQENRRNLCISPTSIAASLAMVYVGARGRTAEEMARTLHLGMPPGEVAPAFQSLLDTLPGANHLGCRLTLANAFWAQRGYQFTPAYLETLGKWFGAELAPIDFTWSEATCQTINAWVDRKTRGR